MKSQLLLCAAALALIACDEKTQIKCSEGCEQFGAVCDTARDVCVASGDLGADLSINDLNADSLQPPDLTPIPDLVPPPDLLQECTVATAITSCSADEPICDTTAQTCRACNGASDDSACAQRSADTLKRCKVSGTNVGRCVACAPTAPVKDSEDCTAATPVCTEAGACRACASHTECSTGACILEGASAGQCVAANQIAYVNNTNSASVTCSDAPHESTPAAPYCQIGAALTGATKPYVVVAGSATAYNAVAITTAGSNIGPLTIIGPGRVATPTAQITQNLLAAVSVVTLAANTATVVVDGFELIGSAGGTNKAGVSCSQSGGLASVAVKNSYIHGSGLAGVESSGCSISLDMNLISGNTGPGVSCSAATSYVITNNIIASNGASAGSPGILISDAASSGTIAFNTLSKNGGLNTVEGGVVCPATGSNKLVQASIVVNNSASGGTQFAGKCQLQDVVTGSDNFAGGSMLSPMFVGASDFHLSPGASANTDCCIDKIATPGTPNASHDFDGGNRPKGAGTAPYDVGAHEVQ